MNRTKKALIFYFISFLHFCHIFDFVIFCESFYFLCFCIFFMTWCLKFLSFLGDVFEGIQKSLIFTPLSTASRYLNHIW